EETARAGSTSFPLPQGRRKPPGQGRSSKPAPAGLILRRRVSSCRRRTRGSSPGDSPGGRTYSVVLKNTPIIANVVDPGFCYSDLRREASRIQQFAFKMLEKFMART